MQNETTKKDSTEKMNQQKQPKKVVQAKQNTKVCPNNKKYLHAGCQAIHSLIEENILKYITSGTDETLIKARENINTSLLALRLAMFALK